MDFFLLQKNKVTKKAKFTDENRIGYETTKADCKELERLNRD